MLVEIVFVCRAADESWEPHATDVISHTLHGSIILLRGGFFERLCVHFSARVWCLCKGETVEHE